MAAYAALVSLLNDLELIPNHPIHSFSFDNKQITSLSQTVHFLIDFMETYDSHGCTRETAEALERRIASAAHAAHDVIESHVIDQLHAGSTLGGKATFCFLPDLQKAIDDMEFVKRETIQFKVKSGVKAEQPTYSAPTSSEALNSGKNLMVGFNAALVGLMEMLTGDPSNKRVIPVVGMGGMGKTTLARNVYEHLHIQHHFDVRLWATISHDYKIESILTELLFGERRSATGGDFNRLGEELHKMLWGRRYLIVLDDMWGVEAWDEMHMFLPDNGNGSCVIVTSRLSNLAAHLSSSPFTMNFLDDDTSWELFCAKVFGEENCPAELEETGKKIAKRCKGLPLSIVVIGGHLRRLSRAIEYWEKVANFMNPISSLEEDEQCLNIISLSYEHLPAYLKPCFLYMGIYQEDERFDASKLLRFWVAEGFIKPNKSLSLEEVAEDYLNDLIDRNLILVQERMWNGKVGYCSVHDIVRELCMKVGKKDKFMCVLQNTTQAIGIELERHIVIQEGKINLDIAGALPLVRSIIHRRKWSVDELPIELRLLRVSASVSNLSVQKDEGCLTGAISQQLNLRYLAFYCEKATTMSVRDIYLPSSIPLFWNLQTLTVHNFGVLINAPCGIWEMPQLMHVEFIRIHLPDPLLGECIVLRNLHTLIGVVNLRLTEEVCIRMPNIKELSMEYNHFPSDCEASSYYCLHNLGRFINLHSFKCQFRGDSKWRDVVLSLTFPSSVEELGLWNCHLEWEELTMMIKSLAHLGSLVVYIIKGSEWSLVEEEFPRLKRLTIYSCDDLISWDAQSSHFPVLENICIQKSPKLSEIPCDIGEIPTLRLIQLKSCSVSAAVSAMRIMVEQESFGNEELQLEVDFNEMEQVERFQKMVREEGLRSNNLRLSYKLGRIRPSQL
ncbi:putative late blight resistance protein homolog R1B-16 [Salvia miltiorrhiza]|uniref:putative late blight resistance protein homolog R1B-16 n=1 Tax=Salvia miltiorrhiza TaxID=226208 RepID=UPI0025AB859F|nr:putative late blight resistance protein homolog R1B-16 [Salvia miltiorrhiza]